MKIIDFYINLNQGHELSYRFTFNEDVNIFTGANGSGKTTVLKTLWYCISGNIHRIIQDSHINHIELRTEEYLLLIINDDATYFISYYELDSTLKSVSHLQADIEFVINLQKDPTYIRTNIHSLNQKLSQAFGSSLYFPTYRRIEGGYMLSRDRSEETSITSNINSRHDLLRSQFDSLYGNDSGKLHNALSDHSNTLSRGNHKFITTVSIYDIVELIAETQFDEMRRNFSNDAQLGHEVREIISDYITNDSIRHINKLDENSIINHIKDLLITINPTYTDSQRSSLDILRDSIIELEKKKKINVEDLNSYNTSLTNLSSGEKQILSFLCYNAHYKNSTIFIDEPELSLHVDWQRNLVRHLSNQKTNNQLFLTTHSPFIYTQHENKEHILEKCEVTKHAK